MKNLQFLTVPALSLSLFIFLGMTMLVSTLVSCKNTMGTVQGSNVVSVKSFGASGNGRTDDVAAIQAAIRALPQTGGTLVFESGTYLLGRGLFLTGKKNFRIQGEGATLIAKDGLSKVPQNAIFTIENCDNFEVNGLRLNGNRDKRPTVLDQSPCHNFRILDVRNADFVNITSINAIQDGFTLQDKATNPLPVRNVQFINCVARNCFRQGLSVINGSKVSIIGGEYSSTHGVGPEAGIDIEANKGEAPNEDIFIKGVTFRDNASYGVILSNNANSRRMYIDSCFFYGNAAGAVLVTTDETEITRCTIEGESNKHASNPSWSTGTELISVKFGVINKVVIRDNVFRNTQGKTFALWLASQVSYAEVVGNRFFQMPRTALAIYAKRAYVIGNTFIEGGNRDIQLKGGQGHVIACNTFQGKERALMLVETEGVYSDGNTFNRAEVPGKLLQEQKKLLHTIPSPGVAARPGSASRTPTAARRNVTIGLEERVLIDATQSATVTFPNRPQNNIILLKRDRGSASITLRSPSIAFSSGQKSHVLDPKREVSICYYDGTHWRVY